MLALKEETYFSSAECVGIGVDVKLVEPRSIER